MLTAVIFNALTEIVQTVIYHSKSFTFQPFNTFRGYKPHSKTCYLLPFWDMLGGFYEGNFQFIILFLDAKKMV